MKKKLLIGVSLSLALVLNACSVSTPMGTLSFDESKKTESTIVTDSEGNQTVIETTDINKYLDQLLESVSIPNGGTTEDLKAFVKDSLGVVGIDLNKIDLSNTEDVEKAEETIKQSLEDKGIDTTDLDINIEDYSTE